MLFPAPIITKSNSMYHCLDDLPSRITTSLGDIPYHLDEPENDLPAASCKTAPQAHHAVMLFIHLSVRTQDLIVKQSPITKLCRSMHDYSIEELNVVNSLLLSKTLLTVFLSKDEPASYRPGTFGEPTSE